MTKDDAMAILQGVAKYLMSGNEILCSDKLMTAIDVAIEALGTKDVPDTNVGDMISRQAAIDEITEYGSGDTIYMSVVELKRRIEHLPSAQPETCKGCKHLGKWENELEYGYPSPCTRCKRRVEDHYER